jgi:hypothetical protein
MSVWPASRQFRFIYPHVLFIVLANGLIALDCSPSAQALAKDATRVISIMYAEREEMCLEFQL